MLRTIARLRVPLGFVSGVLAFAWARPTSRSFGIGLAIVLLGEALRIWASGHIDKGREITRTGPYRFLRHPLYVGSGLMAVGFLVACRSVAATLVVVAYMSVTLVAAIRTEEAALDQRFAGEYSAYRAGTAPAMSRRFSLARAVANREYRAVIGLAVGMSILYLLMDR